MMGNQKNLPRRADGPGSSTTLRRLASFGVSVLLAAGVTPLGPATPVVAETSGTPMNLENPVLMPSIWPHELAGIPGQTIDLHAYSRSILMGVASPLTYASLTSDVCTVSGSSLQIVAPGECVIRASIAADMFYAAGTVDASFIVGAQRILRGHPTQDMAMVGAVGSVEILSAAASSGLPITWTAPTSWLDENQDPPVMVDNACTVEQSLDGPAVRYNAVGTCRVIASQAGDALWASADDRIDEFSVRAGYTASWSVTAPDLTTRTDGTVRTGDLLSVDYTAATPLGQCDVGISGVLVSATFPGVIDGNTCHFEYTIPPIPDPSRGGTVAGCTGPFMETSCAGWPEICVRARLAFADENEPYPALDVADRQAPYDGHCTSAWDDGKPIIQKGEYLNFLDVSPGPADYTFTSVPQVLSWNQADWGTPAVTLAYNSQVQLAVPDWVGSCQYLEIDMGFNYQQNPVNPDPCPGWALKIPAPSAGQDLSPKGAVYLQYLVGGREASVQAALPVDRSGEDPTDTGIYDSSLPAFFPASAAVENVVPDALTWEPSFKLFGTWADADLPTQCTISIFGPGNADPTTHVVPFDTADRTCSFSGTDAIDTAELAGPDGGSPSYSVSAEFLDGDGNPLRDPLGWWANLRVPGAPSVPVMQSTPGMGGTEIGAGTADPRAVQVDTSVTAAAGPSVAGTAGPAGALTCSGSRTRQPSDSAAMAPVIVTCDLPPGDYVATSTATGATGETSTSQLPFTVSSTDTTKPSVTLGATPATSPTNATSFAVIATFDEPVTGFTADDAAVTGTSTGWSVGIVSGSGTTYAFTVSADAPTDGTLTIAVLADSATDAATNANTASNTLHYTIDRTPPAAVLTPPASPTGAATLSYSLLFDHSVAGLTATGFDVSGTATGCLVGTPSGAEGSYTVDVTGCGEGTVVLSLKASSVTDLAGNPGPAAPATAAGVTVDRTAPSATLECTPGSGPTSATAIACTAIFGETPGAGSSFGAGDVVLGGSATGWTVGAPVGSGAGPYAFTVTGAGADGTLMIAVAAGSATDGAGNATTASETLAFVVDRTLPTTTAVTAALRVGGRLSGRSIPLTITWTGSDQGGSGVVRYELALSTNRGTTWRTVSTSLTSASASLSAAPSGSVRFRVRAIDQAGNVGAWATGRSLNPSLVQQSPALVRYFRTWSPAWSTRFSGGSARYAKTAGASATYTFTGRSVALVSTMAPTRGKVKVYVNGVYVTTVDLQSSTTTYRVLAWQKTWSTSATRTLKLLVAGTARRPRVDLDAFVTVR